MPKLVVYDEARTIAKLATKLPSWHYADGTIQRTYKSAGWKSTLILVTTIGHLAEAAWHHPDLEVSYSQVKVKLSTHDAKGITDLDFLLAAKIEETILWRPGAPFSGTPQDARHAYVPPE